MADINSGSGSSQQTTGATRNAVPYLSADWINARIINVRRKVRELLVERIIGRGLLASGYKPFQFPLTDELLLKMTPEQLLSLVQSMPTAADRAALMNRIRTLKLTPLEALFADEKDSEPNIPSPLTFDIDAARHVPYAEG